MLESVGLANTLFFLQGGGKMKNERNSRKELCDLYLYFDMKCDMFNPNEFTEEMKKRYDDIKSKYEKKYGNRYFSPYEWNEYYGLFKQKNGRIGIDPKRMSLKASVKFSNKQLSIMNKRNTTYFHPKKKSYLDYDVNEFVNVTKELKNEFKNSYIPLIKDVLDTINKKRKRFTPGDISLYNQGIYEADEASMSANLATLRLDEQINNEIVETYVT